MRILSNSKAHSILHSSSIFLRHSLSYIYSQWCTDAALELRLEKIFTLKTRAKNLRIFEIKLEKPNKSYLTYFTFYIRSFAYKKCQSYYKLMMKVQSFNYRSKNWILLLFFLFETFSNLIWEKCRITLKNFVFIE